MSLAPLEGSHGGDSTRAAVPCMAMAPQLDLDASRVWPQRYIAYAYVMPSRDHHGARNAHACTTRVAINIEFSKHTVCRLAVGVPRARGGSKPRRAGGDNRRLRGVAMVHVAGTRITYAYICICAHVLAIEFDFRPRRKRTSTSLRETGARVRTSTSTAGMSLIARPPTSLCG